MAPTVRRARADELDDLLALWRILQEDQGAFRIFPRVPDAEQRVQASLANAITERNGSCVFVVDDDGAAVGMALVTVHEQGPHSLSDARVVEMSSVVVRGEARKSGVGRLLVEAAIAFGRERGAGFISAKVFSRNTEGLAFWDRMGFEPRYEERIRPLD